ncbi:response regulator [Fibrella sp. USSR17]
MKNEAKPAPFHKQSVHPSRILIIGNELSNLASIEHHLIDAIPEVELVKAINEEQALAYLGACHIDEWRLPRMILLDLLMPLQANSWDTLRRIKALPAPASQIPVVILSDADNPDAISEAYDWGSSSYLVKPSIEKEWPTFFQLLRKYWWEMVLLPHTDYRY